MISPGNILFQGSTWEKKLNDDPSSVQKMLRDNVPLNTFGVVKDIANAVVYLSSKNGKFINGSNWIIDGGQTRT